MKRCVLLALLVLAAPVFAGDEYDTLFRKHADAHGVDWRLLKALGTVESHLNPRAENPDGLSAGIMQIHCAPAYTPTCRNRLNVPMWPPASRAQLYEPDYNIAIGAEIIAWNIRHYGLSRGIAAYNQWSARKTPRGELFPNQYYVDKVLRAYRQLMVTPAGGGANNTGSTGREGSRPYSSTATVSIGPRQGL
jgi:soluble lytic murein transglycosylase-like protein